jgi:signal transduction histidine kinase
MTVDDLLNLVTQGFFLLVAVLTLADLIRRRDRLRLDIALPFNALAIILLTGLLEDANVIDTTPEWLDLLGLLGLLAQPYLLLRLVMHFRPVPRTVAIGSLAGLLGSGAALIALAGDLTPASTLAIAAYFVLVEGYAAAAFVRGAVGSSGVTRWRLRLAATGTGMLGLVILLVGVDVIVPLPTQVAEPVVQVLAVLAGLSYYLGFAPPRRLRRAWQLNELYRFLHEGANRPADERAEQTLARLRDFAVDAVGASAALVARWEGDGDGRLTIQGGDAVENAQRFRSALAGPVAVDGGGVIDEAWQSGQALIAHEAAALGPEGVRLAGAVEADTLFAVPIATPRRAWGLLLVFVRYGSLFPDDDRDMLVLLAEQSAANLEYVDLLARLERRTDQLEAANKELEAFTYSVSHDLRAPLRAMDGFSRILLHDYGESLPEQGQHYLTRVRDNAQRMGMLIDDLLTFSRLGREPLNRQAVDPGKLARRVLAEDLQAAVADRPVDITIHDLPPCHADPRLLRLVYLNLLDNALKYTRKRDAPRVEVGWEQVNGVPAYYVKDNGAGFDMKYADRLFGVFERLHHDTEYEGTGVGLATVQRVIQRHDGRVWAEAEPDKGAAFYFTLGEDTFE